MALTRAEEALVELSASLAARRDAALREAMMRAAREADPRRVEEVILQSYLFLGYPIALEAFAVWREVSGESAGAPHEPSDWSERGERVCRIVYGGRYDALRANVRRLHPDMERWMVSEGYGKVLGRPGLDLRVRELCIAACLAVLDAPRQLYSHLRGALNVGADVAEVDRALEIALPLAGEEAAGRARATWAEVRGRGAAAAGS